MTYGDGVATNVKKLIAFHKKWKIATMTVVKCVRWVASVDKSKIVYKFSEKPENEKHG